MSSREILKSPTKKIINCRWFVAANSKDFFIYIFIAFFYSFFLFFFFLKKWKYQSINSFTRNVLVHIINQTASMLISVFRASRYSLLLLSKLILGWPKNKFITCFLRKSPTLVKPSVSLSVSSFHLRGDVHTQFVMQNVKMTFSV